MGCGVAGADEGVQRAPQGGQRGWRVQVPGGHGLERLDLRLLGRRQPRRHRLQQSEEPGWSEPLLDLACCHLQAERGRLLEVFGGDQRVGLPLGEQVGVGVEPFLAEPGRDCAEHCRGLGGVACPQLLGTLDLPFQAEVAQRPADEIISGEPGCQLVPAGRGASA